MVYRECRSCASSFHYQESCRQDLVDTCLCDGLRALSYWRQKDLWNKLDSLLKDEGTEEANRIRRHIFAPSV